MWDCKGAAAPAGGMRTVDETCGVAANGAGDGGGSGNTLFAGWDRQLLPKTFRIICFSSLTAATGKEHEWGREEA